MAGRIEENIESLRDWGKTVGEETRKTFYHFLNTGFFDTYLAGERILDIGYKGYLDTVTPILPHAIGIDMDYPGYDGRTLPFPDESQDTVFTSHVLEHIADYRSALKEWFRVLRVGGYLVTIVPHQFLYERRAQPPSLWNEDHKRFYTPALLLRELEESLPLSSFRLRMLEENDRDFDYTIAPEGHAGGTYEIVCVVQKIAVPAWTNQIFAAQQPHKVKAFRRQPTKTGAPEPLKIIRSTGAGVDSLLVLKLDHRGDFAMASDAFEALRKEFPGARKSLVCGPWNEGDARALDLFDEVIPFALFPENASQSALPFDSLDEAAQVFADKLAGRNFDLAIDLRWDDDSRFLLEALNARFKAGFGTRETFDYLDIPLAFRRESAVGLADQRILAPDRFLSKSLEHLGYAIILPEARQSPAELLIFGPYEPLSAGIYWIDLAIEAMEEPFSIGYDVVYQRGVSGLALGELKVSKAGQSRIQLLVPSDVEDFEIRLRAGSEPVPPFRFFGGVIRRAGSDQGLHQREAMLALVEVVSARLKHPYTVTTEASAR
jgi:SAM-dependent methyltransferase